MKKTHVFTAFLICILAVFAVTGCGSSPSGSDNPTITIVNKTGYTIFYVHISPVTDNNWGPDWLDSDQVIQNGGTATIQLNEPLSVHNKYDIRLRDNEGDDYIKMNVTIRNRTRLEFTLDDIDIDRYMERQNQN